VPHLHAPPHTRYLPPHTRYTHTARGRLLVACYRSGLLHLPPQFPYARPHRLLHCRSWFPDGRGLPGYLDGLRRTLPTRVTTLHIPVGQFTYYSRTPFATHTTPRGSTPPYRGCTVVLDYSSSGMRLLPTGLHSACRLPIPCHSGWLFAFDSLTSTRTYAFPRHRAGLPRHPATLRLTHYRLHTSRHYRFHRVGYCTLGQLRGLRGPRFACGSAAVTGLYWRTYGYPHATYAFTSTPRSLPFYSRLPYLVALPYHSLPMVHAQFAHACVRIRFHTRTCTFCWLVTGSWIHAAVLRWFLLPHGYTTCRRGRCILRHPRAYYYTPAFCRHTRCATTLPAAAPAYTPTLPLPLPVPGSRPDVTYLPHTLLPHLPPGW